MPIRPFYLPDLDALREDLERRHLEMARRRDEERQREESLRRYREVTQSALPSSILIDPDALRYLCQPASPAPRPVPIEPSPPPISPERLMESMLERIQPMPHPQYRWTLGGNDSIVSSRMRPSSPYKKPNIHKNTLRAKNRR